MVYAPASHDMLGALLTHARVHDVARHFVPQAALLVAAIVVVVLRTVAKGSRFLDAFLLEQHEQWGSGRKYLELEEYHLWCAARAGGA